MSTKRNDKLYRSTVTPVRPFEIQLTLTLIAMCPGMDMRILADALVCMMLEIVDAFRVLLAAAFIASGLTADPNTGGPVANAIHQRGQIDLPSVDSKCAHTPNEAIITVVSSRIPREDQRCIPNGVQFLVDNKECIRGINGQPKFIVQNLHTNSMPFCVVESGNSL